MAPVEFIKTENKISLDRITKACGFSGTEEYGGSMIMTVIIGGSVRNDRQGYRKLYTLTSIVNCV